MRGRGRFAAVVLFLAGVSFLLVAANGLLAPTGLVEPIGITLDGPSALNEARAAWGGGLLGLALVFFAGAFLKHFRRGALAVFVLYTGGLVAARMVSLVADGVPTTFMLQVLLFEAAGVLAGLMAFALGPRADRSAGE